MAEDSKPRNLFDDFCSAVTEESSEKESTATALFADASMSSGRTDIKHQSEKLKCVTDSIKKNTKNVSLNIFHSPTIDEIGSLPKSNNEIPIKSSTNFVEGEQESEGKEGNDFMKFSDSLVGFDNDYIKSSKKHAEKNASIVLDINMGGNNQNIQEEDPSDEETYYLELSDVSDYEDELSTKSFPVMEDSKCDGDFDLSGSFLVIDEYKCEENSEEELNKIEAVKCKSRKSLETNDSNITSETVSNYEQPCSSSAAKSNDNDIQLETVHSNEQLSSKSTADDERIEKNKSNIQSASSDCDTNNQSVANYCDINKQLSEKDKQMKIGYIVKQFESNDDRMKRLERIDTDRVLEEIERQLEKIDNKEKLESDDEKRLETIDGTLLKTSDNDKPLEPNHSVTQLTTIGKDKQLNTSVSNKPLHVQSNDHKKLLQTNVVDQSLVTNASDSDWQSETKDNDKQLTTNISDKLLETRDIDKQLDIKDIDTPLETEDIDKLLKTKDIDTPLETEDIDKQLTVSCEDKQLTMSMCNENSKLDANVAVNPFKVGDKLETNFRNEHTTSNECKDLATSETVKPLVETNDCDKLLNTCASGGDKRFDDEVMTKKEVKTTGIRNDLSKTSVTNYDHEQIETNEIEEQLKTCVTEEQMSTCGINKKIVTSDGEKQIEAELMVEQITSICYDNQAETKNSNKLIKSDHSDKQIETHISDKQMETHIISDKQIETHISDKQMETHIISDKQIETHISDKPLDTNDGKNPLETNDGKNLFKRTNSETQFETDYCDDQIKTYIDKPLETNNSDSGSNCKLSDETVCEDKILKICDSYKNQQSEMSHTDNNKHLESSCGEKLLGIHIDTDIDSNKHPKISHSERNKHSVYRKQGETIDDSKQFVTHDCETTLISCTKKNHQDGHLECPLPKENNDVDDITMLSYGLKNHISEGKTIEGPQDSSSENPLIGNIVNDPVEYCFKSSNTSSYSSKALENAKDKRHLVINNEIIKTSDVTNEVPKDDHFKAEKEDPNTVVHNSELSENLQSTQEDSFNNYESMKTRKITELSDDHPDAKLADLNTLVDNYKASVNLEQNTLQGYPVISSEATKTNQVTDVPEDDISYTELDDLQEDHSSDNHSIGDSENMDEDSERPFSLDFSVEQTGDDQYKCSCGFIEKENSFIKHLIIHHLINKPYRCCYCKISLERKKDIKKHHKEAHQSNPERWNLIGVKKAKRICSITFQNRNYVHKPSKISDKIFSSKLLHLKSSDEIDSKSSSDGESFLNVRKTTQDVVITNERQSYDTVSKADRTEHHRSFGHSCIKPASSKKRNRHSLNHGSTHSPVETFQNCESERPKSKSYPPLYDQTLDVHCGPPDSVGSILYVPVSNALYLLPFNSASVTSTSVVNKIGPKTSEAIMLTTGQPSAAVASRGYESTSIKSNSRISTTTGGVSNALYLLPFNSTSVTSTSVVDKIGPKTSEAIMLTRDQPSAAVASRGYESTSLKSNSHSCTTTGGVSNALYLVTAPVTSISVANVTGPKAFEAITQTRDHTSAVVASRGFESASSHSKTSTCNSQICTTTGGVSNSLYMVPFNTTSVTSTLAANVTGPKASEAIPQTTDHPSAFVASRGYESASSHLRNFTCNSHICTTTNGVAVAEPINTNAAASINSSCIISNSGGTIAEYDALESIHAPTVAIDNCGASVSSISKDTGSYNQLLTHNKSLGNSISIEKPFSCSPNAKRMHEIVEKVTGIFKYLDGHYICFNCRTKWPEKTKFWWHVWFHLHQRKKLCGKCSGDKESLTCLKVKQVMTIIESVSVDKNNPGQIPLQTTKIQEQNQGNTEFCDASPNTTSSTNVNQDEHILPVVDFIRDESHQTMTNENQQCLSTSQTTSTTVFNQGNQVNQEMCSNETQTMASKNHQELPVQQSRHTKRLDKEICSNEIHILEKTAPSRISPKQPKPPNQDMNHTGHQRLLLMSSTLSDQKVFSNENKSTSTQNQQTSPTKQSIGSSEMRIEVNLSEHEVKNSTSLQELLPQRYGSSTHLLNLSANGNNHSQLIQQTKQQSTYLNGLIQTGSPIIDHTYSLASQVKSNTSPQEALSQQSGPSTLLINLLRSNGNGNNHSQFTQQTKQQSMLLNGLIQPGSPKIDNASSQACQVENNTSPHRPLHQQSGSSVLLINLLSTNQPVKSNGNSHSVSPVTINQETCSMGMLPLSNSIENRISIQQPPSQQGLETGAKDTPVNIVRKFIANNGVMHTPKNTTSEEFAKKKLEIVREIKALLQYIREENNKLVIPDPPQNKATKYLMSLDLLSKIMVSAAESSKVSQYSCSDEGGDATPKQVNVPTCISSEFVAEPVSFVPEKKPILFKCKPDTKPPQLYACSCCRFSTLLHMKFKKHLLSEHHQLSITCVHCGFKSKTVEVFIKHLQRHTQPINPRIPAFKCLSGRCFYQCNTLNDFIKHLKTHEDYDHKCHHCDQQFATLEELHQHYKSSFFTTVSCPTCRARSTDKQSILDHISRHHPNKGRMVSVLKQLICKARIENNFEKMAYIQNEWDNPDSDNDDIQILEAIDCERSVSCETHKDLGHQNEEINADLESDKSKPVLESDQIYNQTLENDKNDQHSAGSDKHILCSAQNGKNTNYSSKNLKTNKYSNIHVNGSENSPKIEPIAPCSESKDSVDHGEAVVCRNKRNSLSYDFGFKCDLCSFVADRSTSLDNHIAKHNQCQISTYPKDFCCTICPATFNELSDLENHLQHHDDKISFTLYGCNVDEYKSNVYSNIRSHLTEHHQVSCDNKDMYSEGTVVLESKVIQCPDCAYKCVNKIVLTEHLKKHNRSRTQKSKSRLFPDTDIVESDTNVHIVHPESKVNSQKGKDSDLLDSTDIVESDTNVHIVHPESKVNSQKGKDSDLLDSIVSELYKHEKCLYICKVCEKSLKFKKALHVHICYHIDIPFKCVKCAFSAKQLAQVISHVKDEHSAEDVSTSFSDKMKDRVKFLLAVTKTAEKSTNHVDPKPILKPRRKFFVRGSSGIISITVNKKSEGEYSEQLNGKDNVSPNRSVNPERAEGCPMDLLDTSNTEGTKSSDSKYQLDADYNSTDEGLSKNKVSKPHNSNNVKTDMPPKSSVDDFSLFMTSIDETTQKRSRNKLGKKNEANSESSGRFEFDRGLTDNKDNQKTVPTVKLLSEMKDNSNTQLSNSPRRTLISSPKSSKSTFKKKRCNSPLKLKMNFKLKKKSLLPSNYKCPKCDFVTSFDEEVMKTHLKQHKSESVYECNKCSVKFHSFQQIEIHSNFLHHGDVDYRPVPVLNIPLKGFFKKVKSTLANKPQTVVNYNSKREIKHIPNVDDEGKADKQSCDIKDQRPQSSFKTVLKTGGRSDTEVSIESSNVMKRKSLGDGEGTAAIPFCEANTSNEMQRNKPQDGGSKVLISRPKDKPGSNEPPSNTALKRKSIESEDKAAKRKSLGDGEGTVAIPFCEASTSNEMERNKHQDNGSRILISRPKDKPSGNEPPNKTALKRKSNESEDKAAKRLCTRGGNDETGSDVSKDEDLKGAPDFSTTERSGKKKSHKGDLRPSLFVVKKAVKTKTTASLDQSNMQIGCRYCHKLFTSIFNIAKHVSIRHVGKKVLWTDTLSGCVFNETGTHMKSSENCDHQNKFLCGHCEFRGNTRGSVKHHLKDVHCGNFKNWIKLSGGKEEPPSTRPSESDAAPSRDQPKVGIKYRCPVCKYKIGKLDVFSRHLAKHKRFKKISKVWMWKCNSCSLTMAKKKKAEEHPSKCCLKINDSESIVRLNVVRMVDLKPSLILTNVVHHLK